MIYAKLYVATISDTEKRIHHQEWFTSEDKAREWGNTLAALDTHVGGWTCRITPVDPSMVIAEGTF